MEFSRDDCIASLGNIQATLEQMAETAADCWNPETRRWIAPNKSGDNIYDLTGTLEDCFERNHFRRVLRWIEFNTESGPARRERFLEAMESVFDEICQIERGNPQDPFRWGRESIDDAAPEVVSELEHVAEYVGGLLSLIGAKPSHDATFVFAPLQSAIWKALDGKALNKQKLADEVCAGEGSRLYKNNGINEMIVAELIAHKDGLGYYRPDSPPPDSVPELNRH